MKDYNYIVFAITMLSTDILYNVIYVLWTRRKIKKKYRNKVMKKNRHTDVYSLDGTEDEIIAEIGENAYNELLNIATANSSSAKERYDNYKDLSKRLISYIEATIGKLN
ncbi:hypothetical protein [Lacrimispora amygdalina]|uniref:hypothetical protein n=1 Tax=Lacrimispora amygdalina TaxID=253257 RepID=UPI000BE4331E|nr:hypothetical protein [Lacrimispora amygdalina]